MPYWPTPCRQSLMAGPMDSSARMDNLGAVGGPILALTLVTVFSVRTAILLSILPGLLAVAAILYAIHHVPRLTSRERQPIRITVRPVMQGRLGRLMVAVGAFELGNVAATLLILRATELLAPTRGGHSATQLALSLYLAYNLAAALTSAPAGQVSDRVGPVRVLRGGVLAFLVAYVMFAFVETSIPTLNLAFVLAGVGIGCVETAEHAAVAATATNLRGSAFGLLGAVQSFGNLAASGIAGLIWSMASPTAAFLYIAAWMVVAVLAIPRKVFFTAHPPANV
jgi:MFS family permease